MTFGGRFSMQHSLASPNIVREYSFSELLEKTVSEKYFLNQRTTERILNYKDNKLTPLPEDTNSPKQLERTLLNVNSMHKQTQSPQIKHTQQERI